MYIVNIGRELEKYQLAAHPAIPTCVKPLVPDFWEFLRSMGEGGELLAKICVMNMLHEEDVLCL